MKNINIKILTIVLSIVAGTYSCSDFLDQLPKTSLSPQQAYTDLNVLEPLVDGLYTTYANAKSGRAGLTFTMLGLDETKQGIVQMTDAGQAGLDNYDGMLNQSSSQVSEMWQRRWPTVNVAAQSIRGLELLAENTTDSTTLNKIKLLRANACFVRAMCMFELTMYWGEVPVIEIQDLNNTAIDMSRKPLNVVWTQIFDDLTYASQHLTKGKQTGSRATVGAAIAMLGKLFMYAPVESGYRNFDTARGYFAQILNSYSLEPKYSTLFDEYGKFEFNSNESVFELNYICNSQAPNYWQWDMGSRTLASLGESCYIGGYDVVLPTEYAYKMQAAGGVWEDGDQRKDVSIRTDFTYHGQKYTIPSWGADELDPHIKKYEDRRLDKFTSTTLATDATSGRSIYWSGKNYPLIRFADVLLCYAECLNELGNTTDAMTVVNRVRMRAWGGILPADKEWTGLSQDQFRVNIMDERMRELCFEGWRRMDLIRTGNFVKLIKERNPWAKAKGTIQDFNVRWPIPEIELKNNPYMDVTKDQNPGY
ncbi:MAG: RagB/SusD family nutrient uptake outer membrane protein [Paludibacter sp.]|nr:RagB/SusD family nutrient uptake outer membrane protein [Paludibacter sp.]